MQATSHLDSTAQIQATRITHYSLIVSQISPTPPHRFSVGQLGDPDRPTPSHIRERDPLSDAELSDLPNSIHIADSRKGHVELMSFSFAHLSIGRGPAPVAWSCRL